MVLMTGDDDDENTISAISYYGARILFLNGIEGMLVFFLSRLHAWQGWLFLFIFVHFFLTLCL